MEGILGFTMLFAGNFAPMDWALCDGSEMRISSNINLFRLLGNVYGGDGRSTFKLPDLRGRAITGVGNGISNYELSDRGGMESLPYLKAKNIPAHTHPVQITITPHAAGVANALTPVDAVYATNTLQQIFESSNDTSMASYTGKITTSVTGRDDPQAVPVLHPVLALNYIICVNGVFPQRYK